MEMHNWSHGFPPKLADVPVSHVWAWFSLLGVPWPSQQVSIEHVLMEIAVPEVVNMACFCTTCLLAT